jgi:hypothetical protein
VAILGLFNSWDLGLTIRLSKSICLQAGTVYCFDVGGAYWLDPNDEGRIPNGWGSEYSVRYIRWDREVLSRHGVGNIKLHSGWYRAP